MSLSEFQYLRLTRFAKPVCDRAIYRKIRKYQLKSIVELGLEDGQRCENLIRVAARFAGQPVRYTGVDPFDARTADQPQLKLIETHKRLKALDARVQLVPGDSAAALEQIANSHPSTDLLLVSAAMAGEAMDRVIRFIPRMLHSGSVVMIQSVPDEAFQVHTRLDIERRAKASSSKASHPQPQVA